MTYNTNPEMLPEGIAYSEMGILGGFATHIVEHAIKKLAAHRLSMDPPSVDRDFYLEGLSICQAASPIEIELMGEGAREILENMVSEEDLPAFLAAIDEHYTGEPMPAGFMHKPGMSEAIGSWLAIADVYEFCRTFFTHRVVKDDPRDIAYCVQQALITNKILGVWNKMDIILQPAEAGRIEILAQPRVPFGPGA